MTLGDQPTVDGVRDEQDRWWAVGPVVALIALSTLGALDLLFVLFNLGLVTSWSVDGFPAGACPSGVTCSDDVNVWRAMTRFLLPLAILGLAWLLAILSLRGPTTVSRRPRRLAMSAVAAACPVVVFVWIVA